MKRFLVLTLAFALPSVGAAQTPINWPALTQKPYADKPVPDLGLRPLLELDGKKIATKEAWPPKRSEIEKAWRDRLGPMPKPPKALAARTEQVEKCDGFTRELVSFVSAEGDRIRAYLLIPDGIKEGEKRPAIVVFHQTTTDTLKEPAGLGTNPTLALGVHLVKRGYVVLCPECYIMKDGGPRVQAEAVGKAWVGLTGLGKMVFDASRCLDYLESLPFVDAARIGCIGHSLGAKEVLFAMAFEPRYQAGVFNEGGVGLRMSNWTDPWYLTPKMKDHIPALENHQVLALCAAPDPDPGRRQRRRRRELAVRQSRPAGLPALRRRRPCRANQSPGQAHVPAARTADRVSLARPLAAAHANRGRGGPVVDPAA